MAQPTPTPRERQVSRKLWIRELLDGEFIQTADQNLLRTTRGDAARINILGIVIAREELPVSSVTIDDGSGQIAVRSFDQKLVYPVGTIVQIIGRPRSYQGNPYVAAEAVCAMNEGWLLFRKKELGEVQQTAAQVREVASQTSVPGSSENRAEKILRSIVENDPGDGAPVEIVIVKSGVANAEEIIEQLLLTGDIFELRPGKVKVL